MNSSELENILICPSTQNELSWLSEIDLAHLKHRIVLGEIKGEHDFFHTHPIQGAFKVKDRERYYVMVHNIIYLLSDLALRAQFQYDYLGEPNEQTKRQVKRFYDEVGWQCTEGMYQDAQDSEDLREVSQEYIVQCHLRLNRHLPMTGTYLLDVASGPIQYPAYLSYSAHFQYRICADISLTALQEARKKLGGKGIYLLCDVTQLPIKKDTIDAVVSLHTLYHVPHNEQSKAFFEIYRILKPGGHSLIVYSWGPHSLFMKVCLLPQKLYRLLKRTIKSPIEKSLYFHAHNYAWFKKEIQAKYQTQLFPWRSVNVPFLKTFIHQSFAGKTLLRFIFWLENRFPTIMGRFGAYPLFVSTKK